MITGHVFIATSLDGFIARENGDIEWLLTRDDPNEDHGYNDFIKDIDGIVMGRGTFEKALTFDKWYYNVPVVVLSTTLTDNDVPQPLKDKVQVLRHSPKDIMSHLEKKGWKRVYVDGGQTIQSFLKENLIADLVITTAPVLIGEGKPLFSSLAKDVSLKHLHTKAFPSGLVQSKYQVIP
ncbi:deaminase [Bdellovibrio bacteriovorus]|uniref:Deaminase n=1 Tax=Bdellovibrio bacteriovorus TaxID=959 RepID=A0A150WMR9_BDEBC|nr:dihydrofolate reductase family protein [Bdellovibrio bacteriovorus]KYG65688.1 deaminase [Bdellovibrio bacteriovorus]